jgi:hypothetical protein
MEYGVSIESLSKQTEMLRRESQASKTRTLVALLAATFLLMYWAGFLLDRINYLPITFKSLAMVPSVLNFFAWFSWMSGLYINLMYEQRILREEIDKSSDELRNAIQSYEGTLRIYSRQSRSSFTVSIAIGLQFIAIAISTAFTIYSSR